MVDVQAGDGRNLHVYEGGDPGGFPVIVHHGTPASGRLFGPHAEDAGRRGIRLIGYDRPGYGNSTLRPGRSVVDVTSDVGEIADALALDRFATWGVSGGGPHALACAACMPDRVAAAATAAANAPIDAEGLDWTAGLGETNLESFATLRRGPEAHEEYLRGEADQLRSADAAEAYDSLASLLTPVDRAVLTGDLSEYLVLVWRDAVLSGIAAGVTIVSKPTGRGASALTRYAYRSCSGMAAMTSSCPLRTVSGSRSTFQVLTRGSPRRMGI